MKTNLKNFPEYNGAQAIELYLEQLRNWKQDFEEEQKHQKEKLREFREYLMSNTFGKTNVDVLKEISEKFEKLLSDES